MLQEFTSGGISYGQRGRDHVACALGPDTAGRLGKVEEGVGEGK